MRLRTLGVSTPHWMKSTDAKWRTAPMEVYPTKPRCCFLNLHVMFREHAPDPCVMTVGVPRIRFGAIRPPPSGLSRRRRVPACGGFVRIPFQKMQDLALKSKGGGQRRQSRVEVHLCKVSHVEAHCCMFGLQDPRDVNGLPGMAPWAHNALADFKNEVEANRASGANEARLNRRTSAGFARRVLGQMVTKEAFHTMYRCMNCLMMPKDDFPWSIMRKAGPTGSATECCCACC